MKAFALTSADQPAMLTDLPDPAPSHDGVLVRVHARAVNDSTSTKSTAA